ncbi:hypothetical protein PENTCL1PPCAC_9078 [Pristionchus entomophagus]|uniref:Brain protein I3 n=1 Tax=Pristionchus entomophagus TaxID=358040 RepID=A0AAV5SY39_9BILA|nr:hypothetical protein PENTCL1PPCAC_9078 [Pristionchus entomophagus]
MGLENDLEMSQLPGSGQPSQPSSASGQNDVVQPPPAYDEAMSQPAHQQGFPQQYSQPMQQPIQQPQPVIITPEQVQMPTYVQQPQQVIITGRTCKHCRGPMLVRQDSEYRCLVVFLIVAIFLPIIWPIACCVYYFGLKRWECMNCHKRSW